AATSRIISGTGRSKIVGFATTACAAAPGLHRKMALRVCAGRETLMMGLRPPGPWPICACAATPGLHPPALHARLRRVPRPVRAAPEETSLTVFLNVRVVTVLDVRVVTVLFSSDGAFFLRDTFFFLEGSFWSGSSVSN